MDPLRIRRDVLQTTEQLAESVVAEILDVGTSVRVLNNAAPGKVGKISSNEWWWPNGKRVLYDVEFADGGGASGYMRGRDFELLQLDFDPADPDAVERFLQS